MSLAASPASKKRLRKAIAVYTAWRLLLIVVVTAVVSIFLPPIVALVFGIIMQMPLSLLVLTKPRNELSAALETSRNVERANLRAALRGD
ncbi:DUF4229 domain-containing protein [Nakamurella antarctica]|uniref:DUF4229 domain-containing protein n=1 Tax=Nakamurella antarctica TaxID=1902245 RepID=A0A3G8ZQQ7_9ACTN|nr:DUF4229 domain-containing protein [Nakamurella antarctica]